MAAQDRTYWHVPGARSWHALAGELSRVYPRALCGQRTWNEQRDTADRLPPTAHLCGNCSRIIAARTDIEPTNQYRAEYGAAGRGLNALVQDVPEPVASEQDDSGIAPI